MENQNLSWTTEIKPKNKLLSIDFKEIWQYRDLMLLFVKRNIITQYKQTLALGSRKKQPFGIQFVSNS
jgi:lipopolysaccharide transport system permease protein